MQCDRIATFEGRQDRWRRQDIQEAPLTMVIPLVLAALISVGLGLFPDFLVGLIGKLF